MSGNQESGVKLPTWRCSDFDAAIPIKKRKYFVQPQLPAVEEAVLEQGGVSKGGLDLSGANENKKAVGGSRTNVGEPAGRAMVLSGQIRVKEEPNFPVHSSALTGYEIPASSNVAGSSLEKVPVGVGHSGVVVNSDKAGMKVEQSAPKTNDIVRETQNNRHWENEALNLSLSKEVYAPQNTDCVSTCNKSGNHSGVNRSNWDLNTTMDAWEDGLDRRTRAKTSGHDIEASSCPDATIVAKTVSEKEEKSVGFESHAVALKHFDHLVKPSPTCSLSLGLGSYPPAEKYPSGLATTSGTIAAGPSSSRTIAGYPNSVNLRTVKSEVIEESVRQETKSAQACPIGLSINRVKQEVVGRINQESSPSSGILKLVKPVSIKAEPNSFSQSEVFNRKDGTLNHFHTPLTQAVVPMSLDAILDVPMSLNGRRINQGVQNYPDCTANENAGQSNSVANGKSSEDLKHDGVPMTSCSGRGDHNLNRPGVNVTSLTEGKIVLGNSNTCVAKEFPRNYRGTDEVSRSYEEKTTLSGKELELRRDGLCENEDQRAQDDEQSTHQIIHTSEGVSGVSTESGGNVENPENVNNNSPVSYKEEISTIDNDPRTEFSEGSQRRIINLAQVKSPIKILDASGTYVPLQMERERLPDFPVESQRYLSRGSDESCKFSRERYHGKVMRSPRLNFIPERRRFSDQTESDLHDRDTKNFEFNNHGNSRRDEDFISNFRRGRRPANDEGTPYSHSFTRRTPNFSFTHRPRNKDDTSAFPGFRDGEKTTRVQYNNNTEPMFMSPPRSYRGRNGGFARGQANFSDNSKRRFPGFRSRSPVRSRERSTGPSSSFRNRSQEEIGGQTDFSHRRSPSGYRTERTSSPDHTGYTRETVVRRHNSPPYSHRPSNGRGRGFGRGRGYVRGRGYGRAGDSFRKPSDRFVHRNHGNMNNFTRERVNYNDDLFEGPVHSERFGVDVNVERRRFGYRHDGTNSFRPSYNKDGCAPTNVENDPDAMRFEQDQHIETDGQGSDMEIDAEDDNSAENASGGTRNLDEEETPKQN